MKEKKDAQVNELENVEEQTTTTEFPSVLAVEPEFEIPEEELPKKKKGGWFRRNKEPKEEPRFLVESPISGQTKAEVEIIKVVADEPTCEISVSHDTKVIEMSETETNDEQEGLPITQLQLDGFETEEAAETVEEDEAAALLRLRQEKIQDFSARREQHEKETSQTDEQGTLVEQEVREETEDVEAEEIIIEDEFTDFEQVSSVRQKLVGQRRRSLTTLLIAAVVEVVLFISAVVSSALPNVTVEPVSYLLIQSILFVVLCGINFSLLKRGFVKLFSRKVAVESGIALASCVTLLHTVLQFFNTTGIADKTSPLLTALSGFFLVMLQLCHYLADDRACRNFSAVASRGEKLVTKCIEDDLLAEEIGRPAVALGVPHVAYFKKTNFMSNFFKSMQDSVSGNGWMKWYLPLVLSLAAVISAIYLLVNGLPSWIFAITLFCLMVCVSMPILMLFFLQSAISVMSLKLQKKGVAVMGYDVVRNYGSVHAVAVDAVDLFPENSVRLHGIKTFSGTRIDEAILDAASVSIRAGGPLSHVFRQMILNKVGMLREVDTLVYEQDMGLSGWVSGRRVLIGNRRLLDNHGIYIPSKDYEDRYAKDGRQLVYLSIAGELSAMFVVSYVADENVKQVLTDVTKNRVTLLVRTCDPNITEQMLASVFDLNGFYVELLSAPAGRSYEALTNGVSEEEPAGVVSFGGAKGILKAISHCCSLHSGIRIFTVLQTIVGLAALIAVGGLALFGGVMVSPLYALELMAIALVVTGGLSLLAVRR